MPEFTKEYLNMIKNWSRGHCFGVDDMDDYISYLILRKYKNQNCNLGFLHTDYLRLYGKRGRRGHVRPDFISIDSLPELSMSVQNEINWDKIKEILKPIEVEILESLVYNTHTLKEICEKYGKCPSLGGYYRKTIRKKLANKLDKIVRKV